MIRVQRDSMRDYVLHYRKGFQNALPMNYIMISPFICWIYGDGLQWINGHYNNYAGAHT